MEEQKQGFDAGAFVRKMRIGMRRHRMLIVCIVVCLVMIITGRSFSGNAASRISALQARIDGVNNDIIMQDNNNQREVHQTKPLERGLSTNRWEQDSLWMQNWLSPAFTYDNLEQYRTNRQFFVERLGEDHPFIRNVLVDVERGLSEAYDYGAVGTNDNLNMHITKWETYITGIDESAGFGKGTYSYVAYVSIASYGGSATEQGDAGITFAFLYDITYDPSAVDTSMTRNVENLRYARVYQ